MCFLVDAYMHPALIILTRHRSQFLLLALRVTFGREYSLDSILLLRFQGRNNGRALLNLVQSLAPLPWLLTSPHFNNSQRVIPQCCRSSIWIILPYRILYTTSMRITCPRLIAFRFGILLGPPKTFNLAGRQAFQIPNLALDTLCT